MQELQYVTVGKIVNTHGNRGMLKVLPLTDFPDRFEQMADILVARDNTRQNLHIQKAFKHKQFIILQLSEIQDMNEAEKYKGALLQVPRDRVVDLPGDTYYIFEITGCEVYSVQGRYLGTVQDVIQTGANDVYAVESRERKKPLLIPAIKSVVKTVDVQNKHIEVDLPDGLEE